MALFQAHSKVQKDRSIMRDTDARMAKYSRRGLTLNVLAYLLCLAIGYLRVLHPTLAVVLTIGLIVTTLIRAFILVRFDNLYAAGPSRWRNLFFVATLLGAAWWSVILVTLTLTLGMVGETPLLWMYTIIFFSTTLQVTSPFQRFSRLYLTIALLPPTIAAFTLNSIEGYMYGVIMLVFVLMLNHQVEVLCSTYWERLEANFALRQKARSLEAEKRDVDASVDLNTRFLNSLGHELRTSLNDIIGGLSLLADSRLTPQQQELLDLARKSSDQQLDLVNNIVDFSQINARKLILDQSGFSVRTQLEQWVQELSSDAHRQGVEVEMSVSEEVPWRAEGDPARIGQVFKSLFVHAVAYSDQGRLQVELDFKRSGADRGLLEVLIIDQLGDTPASGSEPGRSGKRDSSGDEGLWFTLCKGLSECMDGSLDIDRISGRDTHYRFCVPLLIQGPQHTGLVANPGLQNRRLLLLDKLLPVAEQHCRLMQDWGLRFERVSGFAQVSEHLQPQEGRNPVDLIMINVPQREEPVAEFLQEYQAQAEVPEVPILLLLSHSHLNQHGLQNLVAANRNLHFVYRPLMEQPFHDLLAHLILGKPLEAKSARSEPRPQGGGRVLLVDDHRVNQMVGEGMLSKLGYSTVIANNGLEALELYRSDPPDLILMDCHMPELDGFETARRIRELEDVQDLRRTPIIAMTAHSGDGDQSNCFAAGMDDYLPKPIRLEVLEGVLSRWTAGEVAPE
ncbi:response regulator [Pseudomaricurvus sp. HS19]|uniref:ATP-binding response regulator n=1 Tax=Pseudomaricurvus sp. HS19 TaxID=2692626 RepID=UPI001368C107|nr:response regulator [Pseudomaricurvus sp. HS19]